MNFQSSSLLFFLIAFFVVTSVEGFSLSRPTTRRSSKTTATSLNAWTLPNPMLMNSGTLTDTWYDNHHPTARKVVYDDDHQAETFRFVALGDDWDIDADGMDEKSGSSSASSRGLIRNAASWARHRLAIRRGRSNKP